MSNDSVSPALPTSTASPPRDVAVIKAEIAHYQGDYEKSFLKIGQLLLEAKNLVAPHRGWLKWLRENVDFSITTAQRLIRVAEWMTENEALVPHLDFTKAYALSRIPQEDLKAFLEGKRIEDMSKLELQKEVHDYLRKKVNDVSIDSGSIRTSAEDEVRRQSEKIRNNVAKLVDLIRVNPGEYMEIVTELRDFIDETLSVEAN